jgi:hypothetical protein
MAVEQTPCQVRRRFGIRSLASRASTTSRATSSQPTTRLLKQPHPPLQESSNVCSSKQHGRPRKGQLPGGCAVVRRCRRAGAFQDLKTRTRAIWRNSCHGHPSRNQRRTMPVRQARTAPRCAEPPDQNSRHFTLRQLRHYPIRDSCARGCYRNVIRDRCSVREGATFAVGNAPQPASRSRAYDRTRTRPTRHNASHASRAASNTSIYVDNNILYYNILCII